MKEFLLTMLLTVLGDGAPTPHITLADLDGYHAHGRTECGVHEGEPVCHVQINRQRWSDTGRIKTVYRVPHNKAENTIVHELCHVRVFHDAVKRNAKLDYASHGRAWQKCARRHGVWVNPQVASR